MTLIPVSRLSFGIASGGTEYSTKSRPWEATTPSAAAPEPAARWTRLAFLIVRGDSVKLLPVMPPPATTLDRVIETVPEVVDKVTDFH